MKIVKKNSWHHEQEPFPETHRNLAIHTRRQHRESFITNSPNTISYNKDVLDLVKRFHGQSYKFVQHVANHRWSDFLRNHPEVPEQTLEALSNFYRSYSSMLSFSDAIQRSVQPADLVPEPLSILVFKHNITLRNRNFDVYNFDMDSPAGNRATRARYNRYDVMAFPQHFAVRSDLDIVLDPTLDIAEVELKVPPFAASLQLLEEINRLDLELMPLLGGFTPHMDWWNQYNYIFGIRNANRIFFVALEQGFVEYFRDEKIRYCVSSADIPNDSNVVPVWFYRGDEPLAMTLGRIIGPGVSFNENGNDSEYLSYAKLIHLTDIYHSLESALD